MLHHPDYRGRYVENLKRELPRIPLAGTAEDFHTFARVGRKLADLHTTAHRMMSRIAIENWLEGLRLLRR